MTRKEEIAFFKRIDRMEEDIKYLMSLSKDGEAENTLDEDYKLETLETENELDITDDESDDIEED